jgi:hypothetical protein
MASDYGLNFGFRRSGEEVRVAEGRFRTPVASALVFGTMVEVDPASAGYLKASLINAAVVTGYSGLLLQELDWDRSIYETGYAGMDSFSQGVAKADRLSLVTSGAGTKVWFKNTTTTTRADGRVTPTRTMFTAASLAVGDNCGWDGSKWIEVNGGTVTNAVMKVTYVGTAYIEAVLLG